jgi:hypothetical protein
VFGASKLKVVLEEGGTDPEKVFPKVNFVPAVTLHEVPKYP